MKRNDLLKETAALKLRSGSSTHTIDSTQARAAALFDEGFITEEEMNALEDACDAAVVLLKSAYDKTNRFVEFVFLQTGTTMSLADYPATGNPDKGKRVTTTGTSIAAINTEIQRMMADLSAYWTSVKTATPAPRFSFVLNDRTYARVKASNATYLTKAEDVSDDIEAVKALF